MADMNARWKGVLKIRRVPQDWTLDDFKYFWLPREVYPVGHEKSGQVKVPSRISEEEKEGLTIAEAPNMLLVNGVNNLLSYAMAMGSGPGVMFQYLALGNGSLSGVLAGNTSIAGEYYRQSITGTSNFGANGVVSTFVDSSHGNGPITCAGLFGISASGTANSGTLMSEVMYLPTFVKSIGYTFDYSVSLTSN